MCRLAYPWGGNLVDMRSSGGVRPHWMIRGLMCGKIIFVSDQ
jgi:hypothetical protein